MRRVRVEFDLYTHPGVQSNPGRHALSFRPGLVPGLFQEPMTPQDFQTGTWKRLTKHLEQRLQALRESNDSTMSESSTAAIRGKIAMVKELLALSVEDSANEDVGP